MEAKKLPKSPSAKGTSRIGGKKVIPESSTKRKLARKKSNSGLKADEAAKMSKAVKAARVKEKRARSARAKERAREKAAKTKTAKEWARAKAAKSKKDRKIIMSAAAGVAAEAAGAARTVRVKNIAMLAAKEAAEAVVAAAEAAEEAAG